MTTQELLVSFLKTPKPDWAKTTEVVVTCQIIILDGRPCDPKALAPLCGLTDEKAIMRAFKGLQAAQWVTKVKDAATGKTAYHVNADKLPRAEKGEPNAATTA